MRAKILERVAALAAEIPLQPVVREYPLADANRALADIRASRTPGAKVLRIRD
jgi:D-arabinose 1-dehydrogenase-like Zn-dependent alcohol dehydrogenase